jgi:hypothetical protein
MTMRARAMAIGRMIGLAAGAASLGLAACRQRVADDDWSYVQRGGAATLKSGPATGGGLSLEMNCRKGERSVQMIFTGVPSDRTGPFQVTLAADSRTTRLPGQIGPGTRGARLVSPASADDPVLAAFADTGRLDLVLPRARLPLTAAGARRFGVERFLAYCRGDMEPPPGADRG